MAVQTYASTVGTTATVVFNYQATMFTEAGKGPMIVANTGSTAVVLGGPNVTATTGIPLAAGAQLSLGGLDDSLYAITASSTSTVVVGVFA